MTAFSCRRAATGRPYTFQITPRPVGACFARPRNDHRSFPTPVIDGFPMRATTGRPYTP